MAQKFNIQSRLWVLAEGVVNLDVACFSEKGGRQSGAKAPVKHAQMDLNSSQTLKLCVPTFFAVFCSFFFLIFV